MGRVKLELPLPVRKHERIGELDGLRFVAIGAVLCAHYFMGFMPLREWTALGWMGVDLFFVISGFLITGILATMRETRHAFRTFYGRRTLRILPAYYLVLLILFSISLPTEGFGVFRDQWPTLIMGSAVQKMPVWIAYHKVLFHFRNFNCSPAPIQAGPYTRFSTGIGVFWSLSVEELFYLVWAPVMLKCSQRVIGICAIAPLLLCPLIRLLTFNCDQSYYSTFFCRLDSLMAGGCLAIAFAAVKRGALTEQALQRSLLLILLISFSALSVLLCLGGAFRGVDIKTVLSFAVIGYTLLGLCFASIVGLCVLHQGSPWLRPLRWRSVMYVGTISYMLYLIHMPVFYSTYLVAKQIHQLGSALVPLTAAIAAGATIALSGLSWTYFESKLLRLKDQLFAT